MRTTAVKTKKKASVSEIMETLAKSLAFQVTMIMWEDRERRISTGQRMIKAGNGAGM
ncbi:MAG: hypothetical protein K6E85_10485 [Lachnospiraceae bacterium]|nr:hypothetical protein [Lachnospiraceae bacterium]